MNKKIILALIVILIVVAIGSFFLFKKETPKVDKLSAALEGAKKVAGLDLNIAPEKVKWNANGNEVVLSGKGCLYLDASNAPKISEMFDNLSKFFLDSGFKADSFNADASDDISILKKYEKEGIVCNLLKKANPNNTSSVIFSCADINKVVFSFSSNMGTDCQADSDCGVITDGCKKARVCRNLKYEFYNDCENPSQKVSDIDFSIAKCKCESNVCVPAKSTPNESGQPIIQIK